MAMYCANEGKWGQTEAGQTKQGAPSLESRRQRAASERPSQARQAIFRRPVGYHDAILLVRVDQRDGRISRISHMAIAQ
jgi:hypothetical protein